MANEIIYVEDTMKNTMKTCEKIWLAIVCCLSKPLDIFGTRDKGMSLSLQPLFFCKCTIVTRSLNVFDKIDRR